jgi:hypothetical protein
VCEIWHSLMPSSAPGLHALLPALDDAPTAAPCREVFLSLPTMAVGFPSACCTPRGRVGWSRRPVRRFTCSLACLDACDGASSLSTISTHGPI